MSRIEWKKLKTNNRVKELQKPVVYIIARKKGQKQMTMTVFSLNVSSAGKRSFKAGKAKICTRGALSRGQLKTL